MGQYEMANAVIKELLSGDIEELEELTADFLLDMMGVCGVELAVGDKASHAFINQKG